MTTRRPTRARTTRAPRRPSVLARTITPADRWLARQADRQIQRGVRASLATPARARVTAVIVGALVACALVFAQMVVR